jgi:hypothetical protein
MVCLFYLLILLPILLGCHSNICQDDNPGSYRHDWQGFGIDSSGTDNLCEDSRACCTGNEACCLGTYVLDSHLLVVPLLNKGPNRPWQIRLHISATLSTHSCQHTNIYRLIINFARCAAPTRRTNRTAATSSSLPSFLFCGASIVDEHLDLS